MTENRQRSEAEVRRAVAEMRAENRIHQGRKAMGMLAGGTLANAVRYALAGWPALPPPSLRDPHPPWEAAQSTCWQLLAAAAACMLLARWARKRPLPAMSLTVILILFALTDAGSNRDPLRPLAVFYLFGVLVFVVRGIVGAFALPQLTDSTS